MRKFKLINKNGTEFELTELRNTFFHSIDGLGRSRNIEYRQIGNRFRAVSDILDQGVIKGTVKFWKGNETTKLRSFLQFCEEKPLILSYEQDGTYLRQGYVNDISRKEHDTLEVDIVFTCTTPWYKELTAISAPYDPSVSGKIYPYHYSYEYQGLAVNEVVIESNSLMKSPCKITMKGPLTNPEWNHYVNGNFVGSGQVTATIPNGNYIVIDTTQIPCSIKEYNENDEFVLDLYPSSDINTSRFIYLENGVNRIVCNDEGVRDIYIRVDSMLEYSAV